MYMVNNKRAKILEIEAGCEKKTCGVVRNVRDRTPIGSGASRYIMTGVHSKLHLCKKCQKKLNSLEER